GGISASGSDPYTAGTSGVNSFSPFGAGSGSSPLPIELIAFDAQVVENKVRLSWETAFEKDNDYFTIERSMDAQKYEIVSIIDAVGNSQENQAYSLFDEQPYEGISYYRLKQTDFDGSFTYSYVVSVQINENLSAALIIIPNPANRNELRVKLQSFALDSEITIEIMDINGKSLYLFQSVLSKENDSSEITITGLNLSPGIYIISAYSLTNKALERLIIRD
ncbi:MAG: T9SS type A sorting domain-containing protein, partial [Bacteroidetes bacterium]|nr:T9SS type A sorting domain-containing protein [Bacteroidota bacterium]